MFKSSRLSDFPAFPMPSLNLGSSVKGLHFLSSVQFSIPPPLSNSSLVLLLPHWELASLSLLWMGVIFTSSQSFSGKNALFAFSDEPKTSAITCRQWDNNIQFHSVISQHCYRQVWALAEYNTGPFSPLETDMLRNVWRNGESQDQRVKGEGLCAFEIQV